MWRPTVVMTPAEYQAYRRRQLRLALRLAAVAAGVVVLLCCCGFPLLAWLLGGRA